MREAVYVFNLQSERGSGGGHLSESNYLQFLVFHYDMAVISVVQTNNR
jgi:hypothetical protein